jgi:diguanylate cyclase (GGDEF)-like protein
VLAAIDRLLNRLPVPWVALLSILLALLIGFADYRAGYQISLASLYLVAVGVATWYGSRWSGILLAFLSSIVVLVADLKAGHQYGSRWILTWTELTQLGVYLLGAALVDMLRTQLFREQQLARTDSLTGILNSRAFMEHIGYIVALSQRNASPFTLAYIDLDDFKRVNDTLGHSAGDRVLQIVGDTLRESIRRTDVVARLGGDEFVLLLPLTDSDSAKTIIDKLRERLADGLAHARLPVTCSIGTVTFRRPPSDADDAIRIADALMYKAKSQGKNTALFQICESPTFTAAPASEVRS